MNRKSIRNATLFAALLICSSAGAATYTAHYDYVAKPALDDAAVDAQLDSDTATCDNAVGVQRAMPSKQYRACMRQHGWAYRFLTRDKVQAASSSDPYFSSNAKLQPGHYIDHDNGMDCQHFGGAAVCSPPNGTVHYYDPDQGLPCTRTGIMSVCSNIQ
jgi:hypothetical protein